MAEDRLYKPVVVVLTLFLASMPCVEGGAAALFPYGPNNGDQPIDIGSSKYVLLPKFRFYGQEFTEVYIAKDGLLAMDPQVVFQNVNWRKGTPNLVLDKPFLAPFHYNGLTPNNPQKYSGKIYYRLETRSNGDHTANLDHLDMYMANASVAMKSFTSDFAFFVTWENVSTAEACPSGEGNCPSNTFQLVLVANSQHTFAIFGYYKLDVPYTENQLAGMNGGYGRGWTDVIPCPSACEKEVKIIEGRIRNMIKIAGSDVEGRYILLVSDDTIVRGGCLPSTLLKATGEVYPRAVGMLGGEMLSVSGSCQPPGSKIYCRFNSSSDMISEGVMETNMRGRCPVPMLNVRGRVWLELSTDGSTWTHPTVITVVLPGRGKSVVDISDIEPAWQQLNPQELVVRWDPTLFSSSSQATVNIEILEYREINGNPEFRPLVRLAERERSNNRVYRFDPGRLSCSGEDCDASVLGVLKVTVISDYIDTTTKRQYLAFGPMPLGWYIKSAMESKLGKDWPAQKCLDWNKEDGKQTDWLQQLLPCPCTLTQALADWGRWQPDTGCNMFAGSVCTYHQGSKHCVRSVQPTPDGAGNQCCYDSDGRLMYAADSYQGSTPDRSHSWGAWPYGKPNRVPVFSHWQHDVITFYYCCLWTGYRECDRYMERRPTRDCVDYKSPSFATAYGDPHIETFDGTHYHFGGEGDFWLLRSNSVNIQARFLVRSNAVLQLNSSYIHPTVIQSVAMQSTGSDRVVIKLAPAFGLSNRKLDVLINDHRRFFEDPGLFWRDFRGVSVINNEPVAVDTKDRMHSNFTVVFKNGVGVQVAERQGMIHLTVALPPSSESTSGLLGTRDGNKANDFMTPDGQVVSSLNENDIYRLFAMKWNVSETASLFHFPRNAESNKIPLFGSPSEFPYQPGQTKPSPTTVANLCGNSEACTRDYYVANNASIARDTLQAEAVFQTLRQAQTEVFSCGLLDIPMAVKSSNNYLVGSEVTISGCRPNNTKVVSSGPQRYTCNNNRQWTPSPDKGLCGYVSASQTSNIGMIIGIVVGVVIILVVLIIVIVVVYRRKTRAKSHSTDERDERDKPVPLKRTVGTSDAKVEPGTDEKLLRGLVNKTEGEPGPRHSVPV